MTALGKTALLVLLVQLAGAARADHCKDLLRRPTIIARTETAESKIAWFDKTQKILFTQYGQDVTVYCSDDIGNLKIYNGENYEKVDQLNRTTILLSLKLNAARHHVFYIDTETNCTATLTVEVSTVISVLSPRVHQGLDNYKHFVYFVPHGEIFEIICSGHTSQSLSIRNVSGDELQTDTVNSTTVKYQTRAKRTGKTYEYYYCDYGDLQSGINIIVDYYPEAQNFQCITYRFHEFECKWNSLSSKNKFKMSYINRHGVVRLLCDYAAGEVTRICKWDCWVWAHNYMVLTYVSLHLQSCNDVFCDNQTFVLDWVQILKYEPAINLRQANISSHSVNVIWDLPSYGGGIKREYRVEYRLLGTDWRQANTSWVQYCESNDKICVLRLNLPCPDQHYELRVYYKPKKALEDRVWSEPATIFFFTETANTSEELNPECYAEYKEQRPLPSRDQVWYEIREFARYERKKQLSLKKKVKALKKTLAKINKLKDFKV